MTDASTITTEEPGLEVAPMRRTPIIIAPAVTIDTACGPVPTERRDRGGVPAGGSVAADRNGSRASGLNTRAISAIVALSVALVAVAAVLIGTEGPQGRGARVAASPAPIGTTVRLGPDARDHAARARYAAARAAEARAHRSTALRAARAEAAARARLRAARTARTPERSRPPRSVRGVDVRTPPAAETQPAVAARAEVTSPRRMAPAARRQAGGVCVDFPQACL